jgi:hypothetical protein
MSLPNDSHDVYTGTDTHLEDARVDVRQDSAVRLRSPNTRGGGCNKWHSPILFRVASYHAALGLSELCSTVPSAVSVILVTRAPCSPTMPLEKSSCICLFSPGRFWCLGRRGPCVTGPITNARVTGALSGCILSLLSGARHCGGFAHGSQCPRHTLQLFALVYMVTLVPITISVPLGTVRAALRIRGLLLNSSMARWILMVTLPLKVLISLLGLVLASQIVGDILLILAMTFFLIGPFMYLCSRKLYTDHPAPDWERQVLRRQQIICVTGLMGLGLLAAWSFTTKLYGKKLLGVNRTGDENDPLWTYTKLLQVLFEFTGRTFIANVCFADMFLRAAIANWESDFHQRQNNAYETVDESYASLRVQLLCHDPSLKKESHKAGANTCLDRRTESLATIEDAAVCESARCSQSVANVAETEESSLPSSLKHAVHDAGSEELHV